MVMTMKMTSPILMCSCRTSVSVVAIGGTGGPNAIRKNTPRDTRCRQEYRIHLMKHGRPGFLTRTMIQVKIIASFRHGDDAVP